MRLLSFFKKKPSKPIKRELDDFELPKYNAIYQKR